jgi:hypothetical protein
MVYTKLNSCVQTRRGKLPIKAIRKRVGSPRPPIKAALKCKDRLKAKLFECPLSTTISADALPFGAD